MTKAEKPIDSENVEEAINDALQVREELLQEYFPLEDLGTPEEVVPNDPGTEEKTGTLGELSTKSWLGILAMIVVTALVVGIGSYVWGERQELAAIEKDPQAQAMKKEQEMMDKLGAGETNLVGATPGTDFKVADKIDPTISGPGEGFNPNDGETLGWTVPRRNAADGQARGALDAPVVVSLFSDFECPYCAQFSTQLEPEFVEKYVDTGLVRLEWNDAAAVNGDFSVNDAVAGRAAAAQGKFWEFSSLLYKNFPQDKKPEWTEADYIKYAQEAGVSNLDKFRADLQDEKIKEAVTDAQSYFQLWTSMQAFNGVPGFLISGGGMIAGSDISSLQIYVELLLEQAKDAQDAGLDVHGKQS